MRRRLDLMQMRQVHTGCNKFEIVENSAANNVKMQGNKSNLEINKGNAKIIVPDEETTEKLTGNILFLIRNSPKSVVK